MIPAVTPPAPLAKWGRNSVLLVGSWGPSRRTFGALWSATPASAQEAAPLQGSAGLVRCFSRLSAWRRPCARRQDRRRGQAGGRQDRFRGTWRTRNADPCGSSSARSRISRHHSRPGDRTNHARRTGQRRRARAAPRISRHRRVRFLRLLPQCNRRRRNHRSNRPGKRPPHAGPGGGRQTGRS